MPFGRLQTWMPGTRLVLGPTEGRTRVPGMTIRLKKIAS
jgi:hypothetical protein